MWAHHALNYTFPSILNHEYDPISSVKAYLETVECTLLTSWLKYDESTLLLTATPTNFNASVWAHLIKFEIQALPSPETTVVYFDWLVKENLPPVK
jgi:hypothetical protein